MLKPKSSRHMSDERFELWFEKFKAPYTQKKFIHSYKALENTYSEMVIRHLLSFRQERKVQNFIAALPKMSNRRFQSFWRSFKKDPTLLYRYSDKDFTKKQHLIINFYLLKDYFWRQIF